MLVRHSTPTKQTPPAYTSSFLWDSSRNVLQPSSTVRPTALDGDVCGFVWWEVLLLEMYVGDVNPFRSLWNTCCLPNTIDALPLPAKSLTQKFKCFVLIFHNGRHQVFHKFTVCSFNYKDSTNYTCLWESSLILPLVVWIDGPRLNTMIELC